MMDEIDKKLLDIIQTEFPIAPRPYQILGDKVGVSENEAFLRVKELVGKGIIRRLGANFQSAKLGFTSTLCAAKVPPDKLQEFVSLVNAVPGVTHNYERDNEYNIWFTLISSSRSEAENILNSLTQKTAIPILDLPATHLYKIRVNFPMEQEKNMS